MSVAFVGLPLSLPSRKRMISSGSTSSLSQMLSRVSVGPIPLPAASPGLLSAAGVGIDAAAMAASDEIMPEDEVR